MLLHSVFHAVASDSMQAMARCPRRSWYTGQALTKIESQHNSTYMNAQTVPRHPHLQELAFCAVPRHKRYTGERRRLT